MTRCPFSGAPAVPLIIDVVAAAPAKSYVACFQYPSDAEPYRHFADFAGPEEDRGKRGRWIAAEMRLERRSTSQAPRGTPRKGARESPSADGSVAVTLRPMIGACIQPRCSAQILLPAGSRR
jgi:hypothetical protein